MFRKGSFVNDWMDEMMKMILREIKLYKNAQCSVCGKELKANRICWLDKTKPWKKGDKPRFICKTCGEKCYNENPENTWIYKLCFYVDGVECDICHIRRLNPKGRMAYYYHPATKRNFCYECARKAWNAFIFKMLREVIENEKGTSE